jgi:ribosomal protection tetracycline resistance protein
MPSATSLLNLGIVAHVDAGKTSLTERLLYEAGETTSLGSVDAGTTRTDSMDLERRRGITIRAAVTSFAIGDLAVTIVDTPGHPDFIAEVERSLSVLDAAVLVVSAVEGVQPQTVVLWRALQRIGVPTVVFVNKLDRTGASLDRTVAQLVRRLGLRPALLARAEGEGTRDVIVRDVPVAGDAVIQALADVDDRLLERWLAGASIPAHEAMRVLRRSVRGNAVTPIVCGSAITGAGTTQLRRVLREVMPRARAADHPSAATVFAVDRDARGRRTWLRIWSGTLRARTRVGAGGREPARVTEVAVSRPGGLAVTGSARSGEIVVVRGPGDWRIGDAVGPAPSRRAFRFAPPTMQALVEPVEPDRRGALFAALTELAEEDPLIGLRLDEHDAEAAISLHGEVQKEVIAALLAERYGVAARFLETTTVCLERVAGTGDALEQMNLDGNPYLATIGLRIEPAPIGHGIEFSPGIERGRLIPAFITATEDGVRAALRQGRYGWSVTDCVVTMTASGYCPRQSHAHQGFSKAMSSIGADFRNLAPVVVMAALERAGTQVCEPIDRFELDLPDEALNAVAALLGRLGTELLETSTGAGWTRMIGRLAPAAVRRLAARLPDLTRGEGVVTARLDHYAPVRTDGAPPQRRRTGIDPRDRALWFRETPR